MKYAFHIVDVFSSTPFGGNQLAVLPDAAGISTEGMQKIAREFNFGETTFVLPKNDPASTCRVRIFTPRAELDFAGHPTVGTACALVMKQRVPLSDPNPAHSGGEYRSRDGRRRSAKRGVPRYVDVVGEDRRTDRHTFSERSRRHPIHPARRGEPSLFRGHRSSLVFWHLTSNAVVDRAGINRAASAATFARAWGPHVFFFAGNLQEGGKTPCSHVGTCAGGRRRSRDR